MNRIADGSIDMILADLPYKKTELDWDKIIPLDLLWSHYKRIIKPNGGIILTSSEPFTSILVCSNLEHYRHKWVWEKDKAANFLHAPYMPIAVCEDVLVFNKAGYTVSVKNKPTYNPQMVKSDKYQPPNKSGSTNEFSLRKIVNRKRPTPLLSRADYNGWMRFPKNRLYFPVDYGKARLHPTQKPVALMKYLIKTYSNEGDLILDNTMGSGSTGEACLRTNRRFIGIEKHKPYFDVAKSRLEKVAAELRGELNHLPVFQEAAV